MCISFFTYRETEATVFSEISQILTITSHLNFAPPCHLAWDLNHFLISCVRAISPAQFIHFDSITLVIYFYKPACAV
jgi:hypothetical protein